MPDPDTAVAALQSQIDLERMVGRLEQLFALGSPPHANRPGLSRDEEAAYELVAGWMTEAGLRVSTDRFGNLFGRHLGTSAELPEVWAGSHLDTVPAGGRLDGALGVVGAIEALSALRVVAPLARTTAAVSFRDEEGWRFGGGTFGSRGVCGQLRCDELELRDGDGVSLREALLGLGLAPSFEAKPTQLPGTFVELHIEQGPVLAGAGYAVGCVSGIAGMIGGELVLEGHAGHAGTTPMACRADAVLAAAEVIKALAAAAADIPGAVATVGKLKIVPGAANVIARQAVLTLDLRAPDEDRLEALAGAVEATAAQAAARTGCAWTRRGMWRQSPVAMSPAVREAILRSGHSLAQPIREITSGALHDAAVLATAGVPTGMIFVRSDAGGVSHTPEEESDADAILVATCLLAHALLDLAEGHG